MDVTTEKLDSIREMIHSAMLSRGISPDAKHLLNVAFRLIADIQHLPRMKSEVRQQLILQAVDRVIALVDLAQFLSPSSSEDARQKLAALLDVLYRCIGAAESEV